MKQIIFVCLLAGYGSNATADDWRPVDTQREVIFGVLLAADWGQTRYIARHPTTHSEVNPLIHLSSSLSLETCRVGATPNETFCDRVPDANNLHKVDQYFLIAGLLQFTAATLLPKNWRAQFQYTTIGLEAGVVAHNYNVGARIDF